MSGSGINNTTGQGTTVTSTTHLTGSLDDLITCHFDLSKAELPFILLGTILVNLLAFFVLRRMRKVCENVDHVLVCLLNWNDLLTSGVCIVSWIISWSSCGRLLLNNTVCSVCGWLTSALVVWSAFLLVIMCSCRYLSLVKPFYYRVSVTRNRVLTASLASLVFSLLIFTFPMTRWGQPFYFYYENKICAADFSPGGSTVAQRAFIGFIGVLGILTVCAVLFCNFFIVKTLRGRATVHETNISTVSSSMTSTGVVAGGSVQGRRHKQILFERVTIIVSMVYVFCYSPFTMRLIVDTAVNRNHQDDLLHSVTMAMLFMSPILNPIIYGLFNKQFRRTLVDLCRCKGELSVRASFDQNRYSRWNANDR